jgi:hypothetical protein
MGQIVGTAAAVLLLAPLTTSACQPFGFAGQPPLAQTDGMEYAIYAFGGMTDLGFGTAAPDTLNFEFYFGGFGASGIGTFNLGTGDNRNFATCPQCILIHQDAGTMFEKTFYQSAGSLTVANAPGTPMIDLTLNAATLVEVTIDPNDFTSNPVPGGQCYTYVPGYVFASSFE